MPGKATGNIQKVLFEAITRAVYLPDLPALCLRRLRKLGVETDEAMVTQALEAGRKMAPEVAMGVIATFTNGWLTSRRLQEAVQPCVFGCADPAADDSLSHDVSCGRLWQLIAEAAPPKSHDAHERLGLVRGRVTHCDREMLARRLAVAIHVHRTARLEPTVQSEISHDAKPEQRNAMFKNIALSAAHKFKVVPSEKFGMRS